MTPATDLDEAPAAALGQAPGRALSVGTRLRDYEIRGEIGASASSIVYLAWDHSLQRKVALKQYMPASMASRAAGSSAVATESARHADAFAAGLESFVDEARLLARFDHPSLVKVYRFWEESGTAYVVMPFYEGPTLETALAELGHVPSEAELRAWFKPILNAVAVLHDGQTWHQNIGPDEIVLTPIGPVLFGFGAATRATSAASAAKVARASALKPGYAAIELYGSEATTSRGPWTDLYALAAVVYGAITGEAPAPAPDRLGDDQLQPLGQVAAGLYSAGFLAAIDAALAVQPHRRPADQAQFRALMGDIDAPAPVSLAPRRDLMQEPFLGDGGPGEVTVPDRPLLSLPAEPAAPQATVPPATRPRVAAALVPPAVAMLTAPAGRNAPSWMGVTSPARVSRRAWIPGLVAAGVATVALALVMQLRAAAELPAARPAPALIPTPRPTPAPILAPLVVPVVMPVVVPMVVPVVMPTDSAVATPAGAAALAAAERQARCTGILQKASLEQIGAAETEFFKSECK